MESTSAFRLICVGSDWNLTHPIAFARLRDAAGLGDTVHPRSVSRAEVAELADARGSGPRTRKGVGVRVPSSAPTTQNKALAAGLPTRCTTLWLFPSDPQRIYYVNDYLERSRVVFPV